MGKLGETRGGVTGVGTIGMLVHKRGNISYLKRIKIEEKLYGEPIGTHQRSFKRYNPRPLRPLLAQDWRFATPTQIFNRYYLRNR